MPLDLTTPFQTGDLDPNGPYSQVKIVKMTHDSVAETIEIQVEYGNTALGEWEPGVKEQEMYLVENSPAEYDDQGNETVPAGTDYDLLVAKLCGVGNDNTPIYTRVKQELYQWLIDEGYFAGTIS